MKLTYDPRHNIAYLRLHAKPEQVDTIRVSEELNKEYFLPYTDSPWFRAARVEQILNVELLHGEHLHWPDLDVDLALDSLAQPEAFPLIYT